MEPMAVGVALLCGTLFGISHSLLASDRAKILARRAFGPAADRWYRLAYNLLSVASLALIAIALSPLPDQQLYAISGPWQYLVLAGRILSVAALLYTMTVTGLGDLSGLQQAGLAPKGADHEGSSLVTRGIYSRVRHPLYLFALGIFWFEPRMTVNMLALNAVFTAYLYVGSLFEERRLVREFGPAYLEYRERVPRILPIGRPQKPGGSREQPSRG